MKNLETFYILHILNSKMVVGLSCVDALLIVEILKYCLQWPIHHHTILSLELPMPIDLSLLTHLMHLCFLAKGFRDNWTLCSSSRTHTILY